MKPHLILGLIATSLPIIANSISHNWPAVAGWSCCILWIISCMLSEKSIEIKQELIDAQNDLIETYKKYYPQE